MRQAIIIALTALTLSACSKLPFGNKQQAALQVNATPGSSVYLNGNHVGQTPYFDDKIKPGEYTVRLLVENEPSKDWQTTVTLSPQIITVINRVFGNTLEESGHYILQLEPLTQKDATELSVISIPDNVIVKVDGQPKGFTPVSVKDIGEGDHTVTLTSPGYQEMVVQTQVKPGYKLVVSGQLGRLPSAMPDDGTATGSAQLTDDVATPSSTMTDDEDAPKISPTKKVTPTSTKQTTTSDTTSTTLDKPYVTIKDTPTGWLRVRAQGSSAAEEITKVNPGEEYKFLDSNSAGWYQIELEDGSDGWISGQYATLIK